MLPLSTLLGPQALHIPDGFISPPISLVGWFLAVIGVAYSLRRTRDQLGERQIPVLGVMAAFIFAAQALNFPVAGGTSGHLIGATLAAVVLGPWAAVLVMTSVVMMQGLMFQDGGLLVMGWNVFNMGVLSSLAAWLVYRLVSRAVSGQPGRVAAAAVAAWVSVEAAAIATAVELAVSGTADLGVVLAAMAGVHALIGIGEALITVGALVLIERTRPDLIRGGQTSSGARAAGWAGAGLLVALVLATLSFAASTSPDGLERVAEEIGFLERAQQPLYRLLPDYTVPFVAEPTLSGIMAVIAGTATVFVVALLLGRSVRNRRLSTSRKTGQ
jgi:cobalt/nickel transport system permease protein